MKNDTAQWLYYAYMRGSGGMYEAPTREEVTIGEFGYLVQCLQVAQLRDILILRPMRFRLWLSC